MKAVFLDRDGVINIERGEHTFKIDDFKFVEGIVESVQEFIKKGYLIIVITNQSGIAKGLYSFDDLEKLHSWMNSELEKKEIKITEIYFCPHHPDQSLCLCRKPNSLLVEKVIARFKLDPKKCIFIGDKQRDIDAATAVNVKGILIESNSSIYQIACEI